MNQEFVIAKHINNRHVEDFLEQTKDQNRTVLIPEEFNKGYVIGISVALTQLMLTLSRCENVQLKLALNLVDEQQISDYLYRLYGLASFWFFRDKHFESRHTIRGSLRLAMPRMEAMMQGDLGNTSKGQNIELLCIQGVQREFISPLYKRTPSSSELIHRLNHSSCLREASEFQNLLYNALLTLKFNKAGLEQQSEFIESVGNLTFELFKNTTEHGYLDADGTIIFGGIRGIKISRIMLERERVSELDVSSPQLNDIASTYFDRIAEMRSKNDFEYKKVQLLEITIFDSGSGMASRPHKNEVNNKLSEKQIVANCFKPGYTSKSSDNSGLGLPDALYNLSNLKGYMRARTNTCEVFYSSLSHTPKTSPDEYTAGDLPNMEGCAITLAIPVRF